MSENHDNQAVPLPRTIKLSDAAWQEGKAKAGKLGITVRRLIEDAVASEMPDLIKELRQIGIQPEYWPNKTVRVPIGDSTLGSMKHGRKQTGLAENMLLTLCIHQFANRRRRRSAKNNGDKS